MKDAPSPLPAHLHETHIILLPFNFLFPPRQHQPARGKHHPLGTGSRVLLAPKSNNVIRNRSEALSEPGFILF